MMADLPRGGQLFVDTSDRRKGRYLAVKSRWPAEGAFLRAVDELNRLGIIRGGLRTFLEIGAGEGVMTVYALLHGGFRDAIAIEPDPTKFRLLRLNTVANELVGRVQCVNLGVTESEATEAKFRLSADRWRATRLSRQRSEEVPDDDRIVRVRYETLDQLASLGTIPVRDVSLAWFDLDGSELPALRHATSLLEAGVPIVTRVDGRAFDEAEKRGLESLIGIHCRAAIDVHKREPRVSTPGAMTSQLLAEVVGSKESTRLLLIPHDGRVSGRGSSGRA